MGEPIEMRETKPVKPGQDVRLTLDANIQDQRRVGAQAEVGKTWRPKGATAIVMEPNTGAILALANWPRVDANALEDSPESARKNRAVAVTYEPGSTFKAFTVAAALEDGKVTPETKFSCRRCSTSPTARSPTPRPTATRATARATSSGILEHRRGDDRARVGDAPSTLGPELGLRQGDPGRPVRRGGRSRAHR